MAKKWKMEFVGNKESPDRLRMIETALMVMAPHLTWEVFPPTGSRQKKIIVRGSMKDLRALQKKLVDEFYHREIYAQETWTVIHGTRIRVDG